MVFPDLRVEAAIRSVLEYVAGEGRQHRGVLG